MLQYVISSPLSAGCQNCKFYIHYLSRCWKNLPENVHKSHGAWMEQGLSPCGAWEEGYKYNVKLKMFERIDPEAWPIKLPWGTSDE